MKFRNTDLVLGTQLIGSSLNQNAAFKLLDISLDKGISIADTAERYPFPETKETIGLTETVLGSYFNRNKIKKISWKVWTKVTGRSDNGWFPDKGRLTKTRIIKAVEASLKRLNLDQIECFFFHWPDRYTNNFNRKYYRPDFDPIYIPIEEQMDALLTLQAEGKINKIGLANETPWGLMKASTYLQENNSALHCVQDNFSYANRKIERSITEIVMREKIKFAAYSPLGAGILTGKYSGGINQDPSSRFSKYPELSKGYYNKVTKERAKIFHSICSEYSINNVRLAFEYVASKPFVSSIIFGVRNHSQLEEILISLSGELDYKSLLLACEELDKKIDG